jgi:glutathione gamma-glutamylcysteinyltransferase
MEPFFPLSEQFTTQSEPAYCALSTLAMALNAMSVDPIHKMWKKPWRWYTDDLLACCYPLQSIAKGGMTFEQFSNLSRCHGLYVDEYYASDVSIDNLRAQIKEYCSTPTAVLEGFAAQPATGVNLQRFVSQDVFEGMSKNGEYHLGNNSTGKQGGLKRTMCISYSRSSLKQTGDGHVSPLGGYNEEYDSVLIFDVARFKYPPYWVTVEDLYKSMLLIDPVSERSRGFSFLSVIDDGKREQKKGVNTITSGAGILNDNISKAAPNSAVTQVVVNKIGTGNPSTAFSSVITPIDNFANSDDKNDANVVSNKPSHESTHVDQTKGVSMEGNTLRSANMAHQQRIPQQQREMLENMQNDKNHSPQIIFAKTHPRKLQIIINRSDDSSGSDHDEYKANSIKSVQNNNREPNMNNNSDNFINMNNDLDSEEIELENLYKQRQQELQSSPHPPQKAQNVNSPNIRQLAQAQARAEQQSKQTDPQYATRTIYYVPEHIQHQDPNRFSQNGDIFFKPNQNLQHFSQIFPPQISHLQNGFFSNALQHSDVNNAQCPPKIMSWFFRPPKQRF